MNDKLKLTPASQIRLRKAPPEFRCAACAEIIGRRELHILTDHLLIICWECSNDQTVHQRLWPACITPWHDSGDHIRATGTSRSTVAKVLGLPLTPSMEIPDKDTYQRFRTLPISENKQ